MINLGPSWRGGGTTNVLGPPPGPSATAQSWGAGNVERRMAQNSGSSWGSRRVLRVPTLPFLKAQTLVPGSQGLLVGRGPAVQGFFTADPLRALALGGVALGFSLGLRGCRSIPPAQPRIGARAPGGLWADLGSARTSPQVVGPDQAQRGAAGAPALCAPAPAAQLLRMTSSHLPPLGPHLPAGWRRG